MAKAATMKLPVYVDFNGKRIEIGVIEIDLKMSPSGRLTAPSASEIKRALKRVH